MFKDWPAVCRIGSENPILMMVLATIDLGTEVGRRLVTAFPECFSETSVRGPIPLSVLKEYARQSSLSNDPDVFYECDPELLDFFGALQAFDIPSLTFWGENTEKEWRDSDPLPSELKGQDCRFMKVVEYRGGKYLVAQEEGNDGKYLALVPPECIAVDL